MPRTLPSPTRGFPTFVDVPAEVEIEIEIEDDESEIEVTIAR
jgi:hypothetical protein